MRKYARSRVGTHTFYIPTRIMIELRLHAALSWALFIAQAYLLAKKLKHEVDIMGFFGNRTLSPLAYSSTSDQFAPFITLRAPRPR